MIGFDLDTLKDCVSVLPVVFWCRCQQGVAVGGELARVAERVPPPSGFGLRGGLVIDDQPPFGCFGQQIHETAHHAPVGQPVQNRNLHFDGGGRETLLQEGVKPSGRGHGVGGVDALVGVPAGEDRLGARDGGRRRAD